MHASPAAVRHWSSAALVQFSLKHQPRCPLLRSWSCLQCETINRKLLNQLCLHICSGDLQKRLQAAVPCLVVMLAAQWLPEHRSPVVLPATCILSVILTAYQCEVRKPQEHSIRSKIDSGSVPAEVLRDGMQPY